ncbi:putative forkhead protein/ forkhead protein domain [Fasciola gigantica]|uniref:Putative forkhead protein/ forkhead protein domain n=1 Tax=Fasciola gigantica TaxID=46835 RepID=A0A504Z1H0_FASGI|nr:putative forkhead protein/ forkhead protein domain [Fasciola gigantica]
MVQHFISEYFLSSIFCLSCQIYYYGMCENLCTKISGNKTTFYTSKKIITIGRKGRTPVDLSLDESECVSRKHLEIHRNGDQLFLKCFSKNGIFIDGEFFLDKKTSARLKDRSQIRFPSTKVVLQIEVVLNSDVAGSNAPFSASEFSVLVAQDATPKYSSPLHRSSGPIEDCIGSEDATPTSASSANSTSSYPTSKAKDCPNEDGRFPSRQSDQLNRGSKTFTPSLTFNEHSLPSHPRPIQDTDEHSSLREPLHIRTDLLPTESDLVARAAAVFREILETNGVYGLHEQHNAVQSELAVQHLLPLHFPSGFQTPLSKESINPIAESILNAEHQVHTAASFTSDRAYNDLCRKLFLLHSLDRSRRFRIMTSV